MPDPTDPGELALVRRAIALGKVLGGCCEWNTNAAERVLERKPFIGFTLEDARTLLCELVSVDPAAVRQVAERRREYQDRRFYYKVVLPVVQLPRGLFIELVLLDDDPEYPVVSIVNAHEQGR